MTQYFLAVSAIMLISTAYSDVIHDPFEKAQYTASFEIDRYIIESKSFNFNETSEIDVIVPSLKEVSNEYLSIVEEASKKAVWYEIGGKAITNTIEVVSDVTGEMNGKYGVVANTILTSIKNGVDFGTVKIVEHIKEKAQRSADEILIVTLRDWEERTNQSVSSLEDLSSEEIFKTVIGQEFFDQWDPELFEQSPAAMVQGFMMTKLKDGLVEFYEQNKDQYSDLKDKLDDNAIKLIASSKTLTNFAEQTQDQLQGIIDEQQIIVNGLNNINSHVRKNLSQSQENGKHIGFIEEVLYTQLDPKQRLAALKKGMLDISPEERLIQIQKIEVTISQIELNEKISTYIQGANLIVDIASNLGLSGPDFKNVSKGIQVASSLGTAFIQASAQGPIGYLQAASTVSSLIGLGSKKDASASRHQQVMNTLNKVIDNQRALMEGQQEIKQGILALFEGQKVIIENQKILLEQLVNLRRETAANHIEILNNFNSLYETISSAIDILDSLISKDLRRCQKFLDSRNPNHIVDDQFSSYLYLIDHYELQKHDFSKCFEGISDVFRNNKIHSNFILYKGMGRHPIERDKISLFIDIYGLHSDLIYHMDDKLVVKLIPVVDNIKDLFKKYEQLDVFYDSSYFPGNLALKRYLEVPIDVSAIIGFISPMLPIARYLDMTRGDSLAPLEIIRDNPSNFGLQTLLEAKATVDIAITQQNVLSGDMLLSSIYEEISNNDQDRNVKKKFMAPLVASYNHETPLYKNFLLYFVTKNLSLNGHNTISYHFALNQSDTSFLKNVLGDWNFVKEDQQYFVVLSTFDELNPEVHLPLPSAEEVQSGELVHTPQLNQLLILRSKLQSKINDYLVPLAFDRDSQLYKDFLILNSTK